MPIHEVGGEYTARYPHLFDFFLLLASRTAHTDICVPLRRGGTRRPEYGTIDVPANVAIVGLGHWTSGVKLLQRAPLILPWTAIRIMRRIRGWDTVGAVAPGLVGNLFIHLARLTRTPAFLLVRGEKQRTMGMMLGRGARAYVWGLRQAERPVARWSRAGIPIFTAGEEMRERFSQPGSRVHNLYPGLSRDFPVADAPRPAAEGPLRLVTVTRLSGEKGTDDLLRGIAAARGAGVDVRAVVVGDGPERDALARLSGELGLDGTVEFAGFVPHGPQLVERLDAADVFVLASRSEGLPHSLVEAMARALPAIVTEVGGMPGLIRSGGGGEIVPVGDAEALGAAIARFAADPQGRAARGAEALAIARRFTPEAQLDEFCARLDEAYAGRGWA